VRGRWRWLALGVVLASGGLAAQGGPYRWARVSAVAPNTATIAAGSEEGLRSWTRVEIVRGGRAVAILKVTALGDHRATCEVTSRPIPLRTGDSARFLPSGAPSVAVNGAPPPPVTGASPATPSARAARPAARPAPARPVTRDAAPTPPPTSPITRIVTPAPGGRVPEAVVSPDTAHPDPPQPVRPSVAVAAPKRDTVPAARPAAPPPRPAPARPAPVRRDTVKTAAVAPDTSAPAGPHVATARVTFLTTSSAYVSAGKADGLVEGSRLDVVRHGRTIAQLKAAFLSTHQSACQIVTLSDSIVVGDTVRYNPVAVPAVASAGQGTGQQARSAPRRPRRSGPSQLRGRIGLYYLALIQRDSLGGQFSQPSGDIRLNGNGLGGTPIGLVVDLRIRRSVGSIGGTTASQTRVYQALAYWQAPGSPFRFTTGRQYAPGISSVGLVDGASIELNQSMVDYGLFGGTQPELVNLGFSSDISQLGGYLRVHSRPASPQHWGVTVGASGSYVTGHANREFMSLQVNYFNPRFSLYAVQEVDYYRPWRRVGGETALSPTSSFANMQIQVASGFSLTAGVDNRRNVRLYQDVIDSTAAAVFDESFRRGVWAGFALRAPRHFRMSFDARTNTDRTNGAANTYTVSLGAERLTPLGLGVRTRSTRYTTNLREGWLNSVTLGLEPWGRGSVAVTSGWRAERDTSAATLNIRWLSLDADVSLARRLFVIVSAYRETGGIEAHDLLYTGLNVRF
jgi:hypothetical protein